MALPSFKSIVSHDTASVFLNADEFAEMHVMNGTPMPCLLDSNELLDRKQGGGGLERKDGIFTADLLVYVKASDYGPRPKPKTVVRIDQKNYVVADCADEAGIYAITLEANGTW